MGQDNSHPQPGDLIEIDRPRHQHWALYMGDGYVINLKPVGKEDLQRGDCTVLVFIRKVKKQRLKEVLQNNTWRVNNKYDRSCTPLPVEEIIRRAESYNDRELKYHGFGSNCEHFVKTLRYGEEVSDQWMALLGGEVHIPDMTDDKNYPNLGDLIEIKRGRYEHWALYMGDGYVIHVTAIGENSPPKSAGSVTILTSTAKVKKQLLEDVARNDTWRVNNKYDCLRIPFPMEEIIRRAEQWIDREVTYRLFLKNCEHFVTMLRYGEGVSEQAKIALEKLNSISSAVNSVATTGMGAVSYFVGPSGLVVAAAGSFLLATIHFTSSHIAGSFTCAKFVNTKKDILERRCC